MKMVLKFTSWAIGIIIALYLLAAAILAFFITPEMYNNAISNYAKKFTNQEVRVKGKTHISIFPTLSINLADVTVKPGQSKKSLRYTADIGQLKLKVAILPLFTGQIKPKLLQLDHANISATRYAKQRSQSQANGSAKTTASSATNHTASQQIRSKSANMELMIPNLKITNSSFKILDKTTDKYIAFTKLSFSIQPNYKLQSYRMSLSGNYSSSDQKSLPINIDTTLINSDHSSTLDPLKVTVKQLNLTGSAHFTRNRNVAEGRFTAKMAGGNINSNFRIDSSSNQPKTNMSLKIDNVMLKPLLLALTNNDKMDGKLNFTSTLSTSGLLKQQFLSNMQGNLTFNIKDGVINGIDMDKTLAFNKKANQNNKQIQKGATKFKTISASGVITSGILTNNDLKLESNKLSVTGAGTVALASQIINYKLKVSKGNKVLPLIIKGTLEKPKASIDYKSVIKNIIHKEIKRKRFNNFLHKIFNR